MIFIQKKKKDIKEIYLLFIFIILFQKFKVDDLIVLYRELMIFDSRKREME